MFYKRLLAAVLMVLCLFVLVPKNALAKTYTDRNKVDGSMYTDRPDLARKLNSIFDGNASIYSKSSCTASSLVNTKIGKKAVPDDGIIKYAGKNGYINSGTSCWIYANGVYFTLFGELTGNGAAEKNSVKLQLSGTKKITYANFQSWGVRSEPGSLVRVDGHSLIILKYDSKKIWYLDGNGDGGKDGGIIAVREYTWDACPWRNSTVKYIIQPKDSHFEKLYPKAPSNIPVSSIVINGNYDLELYVGESWQPYVEVLPANATNKAYTLSSTDSSVAQVDSNGMVYAVGPGECWVIANANDGSGVSGWMRVIVRALYVPAEQIVINSGYNAQLAQGDWWYPAVDVYPSNATNKAYHLESDNPSIARVYDDGWVEAISTGTCMIYAVTNDYSLVSGIVLEVYEPFIPVTEIIFENGMYADIDYTGNSRFLLNVEVYPLNATNPTYTIVSSNPEVASISYFGYDEGKHYWRYTCNAPGSAVISAIANDGSGVSASFELFVFEQTVPVESIVVTNERNHLSHGEPYDILWEVYPANATNKDVTWTNSNDGVVWLLTAEEGFVEVYCVGCGDTVITVSANDGSGVYYSFPLTVDHVYKEVTTTNPTCTTAGVKTFNCIGCAYSYTESIAAWGHREGERIVVTEPSATTPGTAWICCKNCGGIIRTEEIPALGVPRVPGDANADGYVDRFDALTILQYDAGGAVAINLSNADVNADGSADIYDALLLLQYLAGWNVMLK